MSRHVVIVRKIEVIGKIWQPGFGICAREYPLNATDEQNIRKVNGMILTREGCKKWLDEKAGDFESIIDFHADVDDFDSPWKNGKESELAYNDYVER